MSEPEANNDVNSTTSPALVPVKSEDPTNATKSNGVHETKDPPENDLLLSHVVPPAHILADGRFINLPPPTLSERSAFFERAVAAHRLIKGEDDTPGLSKEKDNKRKRNQKPTNGGSDGADSSTQQPQQQQQSSSSNKKKSKKAADAPFVHPIAIASARLNAKGIDELSKAINLGTLVLGGEYFSLTNVVNQRLVYKKTNDGSDVSDGSKGKLDGTSGDAAGPSSSSAAAEPSIDESILLDQRLRSKYVLRRRQTQYDNASTVLSRHERRLSSSVAVRRILDARLRSLRRKWRLVAPEHGTRTVGPVRPREVVAVDVEVYDRDRLGGGNRATSGGDSGGASSSSGGLSASGVLGHSLGRIARRVPRFATMELDDDYDVTDDILSLRKKIKDVVQKLKSGESEERDVGNENEMTPKISNLSTSDMDTDETTEKPTQYVKTIDGTEAFKTKAEPFAIADPTLGKIDPDFDPDKVPLLTLLFEIEKPSTGFSQCATLSSSFSTMKGGANDSGGNNRQLHPDERVIEALQHSLFCASLFESMRAEIIPLTASNNPSATSAQQKGQKSVVWLSSEMEESFLPPPSVMAGEDTSKSGEARLLCVIHCHEGEVKVQLDDEYSLTVKLIEAGTAAAAASVESSGIDDHSNKQQKNDVSDGSGASGSQTPSQLRTLCRALLLHSQSLYHVHRMKMRQEQFSSEKKELKPLMGFARVKKQVKTPSPHILQSCVGLGCKFIFEKKVRVVLKVLSRWLAQDMKCEDKIVVEWLPLALFDSHSRFAFNFRNICMDIGIYGDVLRVTQICDTGEFKTVAFGSDLELEYFLKLEIRRALNNNY